MNKERIIAILSALIASDADCRCGNYRLDEEDIEAIKESIIILETLKGEKE